jgi:2-hydroxychromene-2-carboxylate isomerase
MSRTIKFYFDFVSPYSYLASTQIEAVAARTGSSVDYLPIHVGTLMKKVGNRPTTIECKAKSQYAMSDLGRWAQRYRVPVVMNPIFGRFDTRPLLQTAISAKADGQAKAAVAALFQAMWVDKSTFESDDVIVALLKRHGVANADSLVAASKEQSDDLARLTEEAEADGAFGAPSFVVDGALFFGNDRIDFVEEALRS